jgi:hypothetical protein
MESSSALPVLILAGALLCAGETPREPRMFFRQQMGLSESQIAMIARGRAVTKVLQSGTPAEIIIFGAVFVNATPEEYAKLAFDVNWLRRSPSYLGAAKFCDPPLLADLEGFSLEPGDIRSLKSCRPGRCGVQLPSEAMLDLQRSLDWSAPDVATQVNHRVRRMALEILQRYMQDGNRVLGSYRDTAHPFDVDTQLQSLLGRSEALPVYLPELNRYLLDYPRSALPDVESLFYWERVDFGLKPTLRLNHAIAYRSENPWGMVHVVAVKQLYASHYFQLALDLTACVRERGRTEARGFYLISLKGSTQQGLTGWKGSILRRVIVSRTRSAQEKLLISIKRSLEDKR